ncbi:pilus assembly protein [Budviciaceae bacterium BWR-B9]|uniref:Pilus assembly protein n=1 Tax=Limnobaculum allomyrinae TaxID=2791986 RepID=A0ABS1IP39_9GAMM|nr:MULTISPECIES: tight adherence pilus pseudopilin TadF [Limnobaculum]MBK5143519.1 pilus assembly protein [Limnobaculum allomyrinae]MBV7691407.1 pilus assembly protein [Limnobaculum sp. M2-1]
MLINNQIKAPYLKNAIKNAKSENGAVTVEFAIVMISFILIMYLVTDFGITITKQGRLDRTSHSLATLIRERTALYQSNEDITQEDVNQLLSVGQTLLHEPNLTIAIDALYLAPDPLNPGNNASARVSKTLSFTAGNNACQLTKKAVDITELKGLSPYATSTGRWVPIYRVIACIPNEASLFKRFTHTFNNEILPDLITSDVVISRI